MGRAWKGLLMSPMKTTPARSSLPARICRAAAALLAVSFLTATTAATAFAKDDVTVKLTASRVLPGQAGKEKLVAADEAKPGEIIQYEAVYRNETKQPVKGLEATVPIPAGLELVADSAKPAGARASTDGQAFAAMPLMTKPAAPEKSTPVPLSQYRALRWTIPQLAPGASASVTLRARVLTNLPTKSNQP